MGNLGLNSKEAWSDCMRVGFVGSQAGHLSGSLELSTVKQLQPQHWKTLGAQPESHVNGQTDVSLMHKVLNHPLHTLSQKSACWALGHTVHYGIGSLQVDRVQLRLSFSSFFLPSNGCLLRKRQKGEDLL